MILCSISAREHYRPSSVLYAYAIDSYAGRFYALDNGYRAGPFFRLLDIVIIVVKLGIGRGFLRQPEGFHDIVIAQFFLKK